MTVLYTTEVKYVTLQKLRTIVYIMHV